MSEETPKISEIKDSEASSSPIEKAETAKDESAESDVKIEIAEEVESTRTTLTYR